MDGAFIIDKPAGLTSHDVVARVRKLAGVRRVGHTGTLDPFATGVLVVLIGRATRLAQFLSGSEKEYEAVIRFGYATDTGDVTGVRLETEPHANPQSTQRPGKDKIEAAMALLTGEIEQTPPMYSAKKIGGRKLYELARRGEEVERKAVRVTISKFAALAQDDSLPGVNEEGTSDLKARVVCSAGTYIRTLAEDLGKKLGVAAHLAELRRTRAGAFKIDDAITLERLADLAQTGSLSEALISADATVTHLPLIQLGVDDVHRTLNGMDTSIERSEAQDWKDKQSVRMRDLNNELIAMGTYDQNRGCVHPNVVVATRK